MKKIILVAVILMGVLVSGLSAASSVSCDDYRNNKCYYNGDTAADYAYEFGKKSTSLFMTLRI